MKTISTIDLARPAVQRTLFGLAGLGGALLVGLLHTGPAEAAGFDSPCRSGVYVQAGQVKGGGDCSRRAAVDENTSATTSSASGQTTGVLRASVTTVPEIPSCSPIFPHCYWGSKSSVYLFDVITFQANQERTFIIRLEVDGTIDKGDFWGQAGGGAFLSFTTDPTVYTRTPGTTLKDGTLNIGQTLTITPNETTQYYLFMGLEVYANRGGTADFSHTARFKWDLPEGVTYSSASGAFNPERITPLPPAVPEPASWALMIGGFGLAGGTLRRTRTRPAFA